MHSPKNYNVHFRLYGVNHLQDQLVDILYSPAQQWFSTQVENYNKNKPLIAHMNFFNLVTEALNRIQHLRVQKQVRKHSSEEALEVQFPIEHRPAFEETIPGGFRPQLRKHFYEVFDCNVLTHLYIQTQKYDVVGTPMYDAYTQVFHAFKQAITQSDNAPESTFWIENEISMNDQSNESLSNTLQPESP